MPPPQPTSRAQDWQTSRLHSSPTAAVSSSMQVFSMCSIANKYLKTKTKVYTRHGHPAGLQMLPSYKSQHALPSRGLQGMLGIVAPQWPEEAGSLTLVYMLLISSVYISVWKEKNLLFFVWSADECWPGGWDLTINVSCCLQVKMALYALIMCMFLTPPSITWNLLFSENVLFQMNEWLVFVCNHRVISKVGVGKVW